MVQARRQKAFGNGCIRKRPQEVRDFKPIRAQAAWRSNRPLLALKKCINTSLCVKIADSTEFLIMPKEKRALLDDFCRRMILAGAEPSIAEFEASARRQIDAYTSGTLGILKSGDPVDGKYCRVLVRMRHEAGQERLRAMINDFLRSRGIVDPDTAEDDVILNAICKPAGEEENDWIIAGIKGIGHLFDTRRSVSDICEPCNNAREVMQAVRWQYIDCGRLRARDSHLRPQEAIAITEALAQLQMKYHQERIIGWSKIQKRLVMMVMGDKTPIAMSLVLPLKPDTWHELRSGFRMSWSITPRELEVPSNYLFHDMLAQRPVDESGEARAYTRPSMLTALRQYGTLAAIDDPLTTDLHILSIATNALARRRLEGLGYKPVGTKMGGCDVDFYEKHILHDKVRPVSVDSLFVTAMAKLRDHSI